CQLPNEFPNGSYYLNQTTLDQYFPYDPLQHKWSSCEMLADNKTQPCKDFIFDDTVYGYTSVIENVRRHNLLLHQIPCLWLALWLVQLYSEKCQTGMVENHILYIPIIQVISGIIAHYLQSIIYNSKSYCRSHYIRCFSGGVCQLKGAVNQSNNFALKNSLEMVGPSKDLLQAPLVKCSSLWVYVDCPFCILYKRMEGFTICFDYSGSHIFMLLVSHGMFIPESARWLLQKQSVRGKKLIHIAAKANKVSLSDDTLNSLLASSEENYPNEKTATVLDIFKHPNLRKRALIIFFDWFANNITYYGLSWNSKQFRWKSLFKLCYIRSC
ncbi:hypothetical protein NQ317_008749, partial [Molorchus minor]